MAAAIGHDLTSHAKHDEWWQTYTDAMSGYVGLYGLIADLAIAICAEPQLDEVFLYDLSLWTTEQLLAGDPYVMDHHPEEHAKVVAALVALAKAEEAALPFRLWCDQVDMLCRKHLYCSWAELAGDVEPLQTAFDNHETPLEFVRGWRDHYELEWVN
jgi:hypothetical protein